MRSNEEILMEAKQFWFLNAKDILTNPKNVPLKTYNPRTHAEMEMDFIEI